MAQRVPDLRAKMRERGLDALLVTHPSNRFYLSEAYKDKAAFKDHKKGRFFQDFFADISGYYTLKELVKGTLIEEDDVQYLFE